MLIVQINVVYFVTDSSLICLICITFNSHVERRLELWISQRITVKEWYNKCYGLNVECSLQIHIYSDALYETES